MEILVPHRVAVTLSKIMCKSVSTVPDKYFLVLAAVVIFTIMFLNVFLEIVIHILYI